MSVPATNRRGTARLPAEARLLPGADLVAEGLSDLRHNRRTVPALLVLVAAPRLRRLGLGIPRRRASQTEHKLYSLLEEQFGSGAHSQYNSLIRRIVSYARALEREQSRREA